MSDAPNPGQAPQAPTIGFDDFMKVNLRVAKIVEARDHPKADKLLVLKADLGGEQRQLVAGIKGHYTLEQLVGMNIIVVTNLAPRKMRGEMSEGMLLAAVSGDESQIVLLTVDRDIAPGSSVS
jgi:methionyl-tRNA synthetase